MCYKINNDLTLEKDGKKYRLVESNGSPVCITCPFNNTECGILGGASTAYNITVSVKKIKKEGKWVADQSFQTIQTRRVSHGFYNSHEVGSKWKGESPSLRMYDR